MDCNPLLTSSIKVGTGDLTTQHVRMELPGCGVASVSWAVDLQQADGTWETFSYSWNATSPNHISFTATVDGLFRVTAGVVDSIGATIQTLNTFYRRGALPA